jgi:hypothetical protein
MDRLPPPLQALDGHRTLLLRFLDAQTSLPDPPDNAVIRTLAEIRETVGLALNDRSTTWHPGIDAVLDESR